MEARFHLNRWRITGVWPTGAQVRRTTGRSETPDSSQNTTTARRRRALRQILRPVLGHPTGDGLLVALDRAAGGALQAIVQAVAQQLPDVAGMVTDAGQPLDHGGDPGQGPVVGVEAVGAGTLAQRPVDGGKLGVGQARGLPGRAGAAQRVQAAGAPARVPATDVLAGHAELAGDLGLGAAGSEQRAGLHADLFEGLAVARTAGVAAVGGWSHPAMLPGEAPIMSPERANLFNGSLLATVIGRGGAAARHGLRQAATAAGAAGAPSTTPATSVQARPRGSTSRAPGAAPAARPPARRAGSRCCLVVSPRAPAEAGWTSDGDGAGGGSANQARQQNENAQATSCQCRRMARSLRTWKSAQPSSCFTCL